MTKLDDLTIGEAKAICAIFNSKDRFGFSVSNTDDPVAGYLVCNEVAIVVADRGWVWVGKCTHKGDSIWIDGAQCIRRWGTTNGLGQLAKEGPLSETILETASAVRIPIGSVIAVIPCEASKWK